MGDCATQSSVCSQKDLRELSFIKAWEFASSPSQHSGEVNQRRVTWPVVGLCPVNWLNTCHFWDTLDSVLSWRDTLGRAVPLIYTNRKIMNPKETSTRSGTGLQAWTNLSYGGKTFAIPLASCKHIFRVPNTTAGLNDTNSIIGQRPVLKVCATITRLSSCSEGGKSNVMNCPGN